MPIVRKFVESYFNKIAERGVDPMECVAIGAAIQGSVISGEVKDILLLDVTPLSLGVETIGSIFTKVIDRNTTIPTKKIQLFTTAQDNQVNVDINILQGERTMAQDNISLGKFTLTGVPLAPRGIPQIEVIFDIDANGILHVFAKDLATGKKQNITVTGSTRLTKDQIENMQKESEKYLDEDKQRKEWAETKNEAETLIYNTQKTLNDLGDKISNDDKKELENAIKVLYTCLDGKNTDIVREKFDLLTSVLHRVTTSLYQKTSIEDNTSKTYDSDTDSVNNKEYKDTSNNSHPMNDDSDEYWENDNKTK
jgi:molecular chaperone DnaK